MAGDLLDDKEELPRALDRLLMELDDVSAAHCAYEALYGAENDGLRVSAVTGKPRKGENASSELCIQG